MKKITGIFVIVLCLASLAIPVLAAGKEGNGIHAGVVIAGGGDDNESPGGKPVAEPGGKNTTSYDKEPRETPVKIQKNATVAVRNNSALRENLQKNRMEYAASLANSSSGKAGWMKNENDISVAVHSLLAMENVTGGIGPQISEIARTFNNSVQSTFRLEERIQNRDAFSRLFFGGDQPAARELANITSENQVRIMQIQQLVNTTEMDAETRTLMEEQIRALDQNVAEWQRLAAQEQNDHGLFGWIGR
ncbi:MAG: hypothetical protein WC593_13570 [Methanoregula sp.]